MTSRGSCQRLGVNHDPPARHPDLRETEDEKVPLMVMGEDVRVVKESLVQQVCRRLETG